MKTQTAAVVIIALGLVACGPSPEAVARAIVETQTAAPTATFTPSATAAATAEPTRSPDPTPTPFPALAPLGLAFEDIEGLLPGHYLATYTDVTASLGDRSGALDRHARAYVSQTEMGPLIVDLRRYEDAAYASTYNQLLHQSFLRGSEDLDWPTVISLPDGAWMVYSAGSDDVALGYTQSAVAVMIQLSLRGIAADQGAAILATLGQAQQRRLAEGGYP